MGRKCWELGWFCAYTIWLLNTGFLGKVQLVRGLEMEGMQLHDQQ